MNLCTYMYMYMYMYTEYVCHVCLHVTRRHGQTVCVHFMVLLIMILVQDLEVLIH